MTTWALVLNSFRFYARSHVGTLLGVAVGAMVLVGATIVGSIETVWEGTITPPTRDDVKVWDYPDQNITLEKGAEMGRFKLGSTVILLFPKDTMTWEDSMKAHAPTVMGTALARKK